MPSFTNAQADEVANGGAAAGEGEGGTIPAGVTEELAAEHAEQSQARREADAIFAMDATVAAAENSTCCKHVLAACLRCISASQHP